MKGISRILLLMAVVTVIVGCATYRLDSPSYTLSTVPDAPKVYIAPYHFVGGPGVGRLKGDWQRDKFIKAYLAKTMPVVFTDNPKYATVTVVTKKMWISGGWLEINTETVVNGKIVKTCAVDSSHLKLSDQSDFERWANGDGELMAGVIGAVVRGREIGNAYAQIIHGEHYKYSGITNIDFK